jgi:hypothetical protein
MLAVPWVVFEMCICSTGRRWAADEEDLAEQQPHCSTGCDREGGRPQHPVIGSGGFILYRWCYYREDCLVEAACKGWQIGLMNPHIMGFKFIITMCKKKLMYDDISQVLPLNYPSPRTHTQMHTQIKQSFRELKMYSE